jgi:hypothetical protein
VLWLLLRNKWAINSGLKKAAELAAGSMGLQPVLLAALPLPLMVMPSLLSSVSWNS